MTGWRVERGLWISPARLSYGSLVGFLVGIQNGVRVKNNGVRVAVRVGVFVLVKVRVRDGVREAVVVGVEVRVGVVVLVNVFVGVEVGEFEGVNVADGVAVCDGVNVGNEESKVNVPVADPANVLRDNDAEPATCAGIYAETTPLEEIAPCMNLPSNLRDAPAIWSPEISI